MPGRFPSIFVCNPAGNVWTMFKELFELPNLVSLSRIVLTPFVGYFLAKQDSQSPVVCLILLMVAGITDGLDGYLARRMNKVSDLGKALDPIADKIFAGTLIILLILYREFPIWLAFVIVGRDLLILVAGLILIKDRKLVPSSNLTGKYTFGAVAFLLGSYVIRFQFGIWLTTWMSLALIVASTVIYAKVFVDIKRTGAAHEFNDTQFARTLRTGATLLFLLIFFLKLFHDLL